MPDEQVGTGDLRFEEIVGGGFSTVKLYDADDYETILLDKGDVVALRNRLTKFITDYKLEPPSA